MPFRSFRSRFFATARWQWRGGGFSGRDGTVWRNRVHSASRAGDDGSIGHERGVDPDADLVLTEKSVLVAAVDVAADDGYASGDDIGASLDPVSRQIRIEANSFCGRFDSSCRWAR